MGEAKGNSRSWKCPRYVLFKKNLVFIKGVNKRLPRTMNFSEENHLVYVMGRRQLVTLTQ